MYQYFGLVIIEVPIFSLCSVVCGSRDCALYVRLDTAQLKYRGNPFPPDDPIFIV